MIFYDCDRCGRQVDYADWFPVDDGKHWCWDCVVLCIPTEERRQFHPSSFRTPVPVGYVRWRQWLFKLITGG
jgi:hypothetical protein